MNIYSTYIIQSKHFFISDLFYKRGIKKKFSFFKSKSCLNDLIFSEHSNVNLFDGRLWLNCGIADKFGFFEKKYIINSLSGEKKFIFQILAKYEHKTK